MSKTIWKKGNPMNTLKQEQDILNKQEQEKKKQRKEKEKKQRQEQEPVQEVVQEPVQELLRDCQDQDQCQDYGHDLLQVT